MEQEITNRLARSKNLPFPTIYVEAIQGEYSEWALDVEKCVGHRGKWRTDEFQHIDCDENSVEDMPLDLEIGTGNGYFFAHRAETEPGRLLLGMEVKYKPLIQTIRRALKTGARNAKILRYHATDIHHLFGPEELNNVYIHHPDPWPRRKQNKNRLINTEFLNSLYSMQKKQGYLEFKTDHLDYFEWALDFFKKSEYNIVGHTFDLHNSEFASKNFVTHFEKIFLQKGQPIYYALLQK